MRGTSAGAILMTFLAATAAEPLGFTVKLDTVLEHDDGKFLWFHPRVAADPQGRAETASRPW